MARSVCLPRSTRRVACDAMRQSHTPAVNSAQMQLQEPRGESTRLGNEALTNMPSAPVGFVPKLLIDRWSYIVSLKDYFDVCGFALFSDERGVIYESSFGDVPSCGRQSRQRRALSIEIAFIRVLRLHRVDFDPELGVHPHESKSFNTSWSSRPGNRQEEGALFKCVDVVRDAMVERKQPA